MRRLLLGAAAAASAIVLAAPAGAQARTPCPGETAVPTSANATQVSDAVFCLTNRVRAHFGLPALRRDGRLDEAARRHSQDMAARGYFSHTSPEGLSPSDRAGAAGYPHGAGENIAAGYRDARAVVDGWLKSAGHCRNMLSAAKDLGVGTAVSSRPYYTQNFGDHSAQRVDSAPSAACPHALDLDALTGTGDAPAAGSPVSPPSSAPAPAPSEDPGAPADPAVATDALASPALGGLRISRSSFRAGSRVTVSYRLSAPATVRLRVERRLAGRRNGRRCAAARRSQRGARRCERFRALRGKSTHAGDAGANTVSFSGRLRGRLLAPGRYRLRIDVEGQTRGGAAVAFRIVRR